MEIGFLGLCDLGRPVFALIEELIFQLLFLFLVVLGLVHPLEVLLHALGLAIAAAPVQERRLGLQLWLEGAVLILQYLLLLLLLPLSYLYTNKG